MEITQFSWRRGLRTMLLVYRRVMAVKRGSGGKERFAEENRERRPDRHAPARSPATPGTDQLPLCCERWRRSLHAGTEAGVGDDEGRMIRDR